MARKQVTCDVHDLLVVVIAFLTCSDAEALRQLH